MMTFGEQILRYRAEHGIGQAECAKRFGVSLNTIRTWERGTAKPHQYTELRAKMIMEREEK